MVKVTCKKTATELAAEKARQRIHAERLKEQAKKSHKDRVSEFNEKLAKLSEHHDIPKVQFYYKCSLKFVVRRWDLAKTNSIFSKNNKNNLLKCIFGAGFFRSLA